MKIRLDLSSHCIETEIKRLHNQTLSRYFKTDETEKIRLEAILEGLECAMKNLDFGGLRTTHPALAGGTAHKAALSLENGRPQILVDGRPVNGVDP